MGKWSWRALFCLFGWTPVLALARPLYHVTDLGTLGGQFTYATDINENGQVVGYSQSATSEHAFIWADGLIADLGTLQGSPNSRAFGISATGVVAGWSTTNGRGTHAFTWTQQKGMREVAISGDVASFAMSVNRFSDLAGSYITEEFAQRAFAIIGGRFLDLETLGGDYSEAVDINDAQRVVGTSTTEQGDAHAFVWNEDDGLLDLGTLGGAFSSAQAINEHGAVVGLSDNGESLKAFHWTEAGGMIQLGGSIESAALDISDRGLIVGQSFTEEGSRAAFWTDSGEFFDLNGVLDSSGDDWVLESAVAINNRGQIVGYGLHDGEVRSFLLTPVPEPGAFVAVAFGLGGLAFRRLKRRLHP